MPSGSSQPDPLMRPHKSTTDIPHSPHRWHGSIRGQRPSIKGPTKAELALFHRCSQANGVPRHAPSVPNMANPSPLRAFTPSPHRTPSRSPTPSLTREMDRMAKAYNKLLESECAHMPTFPPEAREQLRYVSKDGKCRVNLCHIAERGRFLCDFFTSFVGGEGPMDSVVKSHVYMSYPGWGTPTTRTVALTQS